MQSDRCSGKVCTVKCDSARGMRPVMPPGCGNTCHTASAIGVRHSSSTISAKRVRTVTRSATRAGSHPRASTTHSQPQLITLVRLYLGLTALGTELRRSRNGLTAFAAELRRSLRRRRGPLRTTNRIRHGLAHGQTSAQAGSEASAPALVRGCRRDGLGNLELRIVAEIADHIHADALVQATLQLLGEGKVLHDERIEREAQFGERRRDLLGDSLA